MRTPKKDTVSKRTIRKSKNPKNSAEKQRRKHRDASKISNRNYRNLNFCMFSPPPSEKAEKKIQWVAGKDALQIKVIIPDLLFINEEFNKDSLKTHEVITESAYSNLKDDAEIQFVRHVFKLLNKN